MSIPLPAAETPEPPSSASPSFVIGRDAEGHWLAVETHGLGGGLFRSQDAAFRYATFETDHRFGAVQIVTEAVALRL
jgi:hypothetical protein